MWTPQRYLDLCCEFYENGLNVNQSSKPDPEISDTNGVPLVEFPRALSCCLLKPTHYDLDALTYNLIPSYGLRSSNESALDPVGRDDFNYSTWPFPNDIWNMKPGWEVGTKTAAVLPLVIMAVIGNLTVIRIILKARLTKNPVNLFILNLSTADLLTALIFPWILLVSDFYQIFTLGEIVCKYEGFVLVTLMLTSVLSLTVISYDRLTAVVFPFKKRMEPRRARIVIYCIWIIACSVSSPLIVWRTLMTRDWKDFHEVWCREDVQALKNYWLVLVVVLVWIPIFVFTLSYTTIVIKLETLEKRQRDHPITQVQFKSRIIRMLFIILILFAICWVPFTALIFVRNYRTTNASAQSEANAEWYRILFFISHYLMLVNSAVNPVIYGLKNDNFRREFRRTLPSCLKRNRQVEVSTVGGGGNKRLVSTKKTTGLQKLADKYAIILTPTLLSINVPSLSSFERRNSALVDLGLPVPVQGKKNDLDLLEYDYRLFDKRE